MPKATPLIERYGWISSQNTVFCEGRVDALAFR